MRRKRQDVWNKTWVLVSTIAGFVIVLAMAGIFFMGSGPGSAVAPDKTVTTAPTQVVTPVQGKTPQPAETPQSTPLASGTPVSMPVTIPLSVPASGIVVRVSYIGGFSGTYGIDGACVSARDSGDKIYALNKTSGTAFATFKKEDGTERHEITAEIIRDGKTLRFAQNSSACGVVSINYTV
jgi:hypothetical protein